MQRGPLFGRPDLAHAALSEKTSDPKRSDIAIRRRAGLGTLELAVESHQKCDLAAQFGVVTARGVEKLVRPI